MSGRRLASLIASPLAWGCDGPAPTEETGVHFCDRGEPAVEVTPARGAWGELHDGGTLWCGTPPQGGAPYSPFRLRMHGPEVTGDGIEVELIATEQGTGEELAYTSLTMGLVCANVGENEGYWVGSEAHMRYTLDLEDLAGRAAELLVRATSMTDPSVVAEMRADVSLVLD